MRIAVVGTGYVGLVSGACFADAGHTVVCADADPAKIAALDAGKVAIFEPDLQALVVTNVASGRLSFTGSIAEAMRDAALVFIAVGTPQQEGDGQADLSQVEAAARAIAAALSGFATVAIKSTVPVGTADAVEAIVREANPMADVAVVSNPEFLREGSAIGDFQQPDRIVVGADEDRGRTLMAELYAPFAARGVPVLHVSRRTAELTKYAANSFLAMKLAFINEVADLCEAAGADVADVAEGLGLDARIGPKFLNAGPGFGGSCFPKDMQALAGTAKRFGKRVDLVETTIAVNERRFLTMADKIASACGGTVRGKRIAILGLTFKPDTDDVRSSPSIAIIGELQARGASISAFDPQGMTAAARVLHGVVFAANPYDAALDADAAVIITEWQMFRELDLERLRDAMTAPVLVDLRNLYDSKSVEASGFAYFSVGRPNVDPAGTARR